MRIRGRYHVQVDLTASHHKAHQPQVLDIQNPSQKQDRRHANFNPFGTNDDAAQAPACDSTSNPPPSHRHRQHPDRQDVSMPLQRDRRRATRAAPPRMELPRLLPGQ